MGCDIHPHIEIKINGKWEHYGIPMLKRNYDLFAKAANVRNDDNEIVPIAMPRGLPNDLSVITKFCADMDGTDGHSHSWLNSNELAELIHFHESQYESKDRSLLPIEQWGYFFDNSFDGWNDYPKYRPIGVEDLRLVFWFDN